MYLSKKEKTVFKKLLMDICEEDAVGEMRKYMQHGNTSTFIHCVAVAYVSFWIHCRFCHCRNLKSLIRGAVLHDFYLYDWHDQDDKRNILHGFYHPGIALKNSRKYFQLTPIEEDIIDKHMWPLTLMKMPKHKETVIVCIADKICSTMETFHHPVKIRV